MPEPPSLSQTEELTLGQCQQSELQHVCHVDTSAARDGELLEMLGSAAPLISIKHLAEDCKALVVESRERGTLATLELVLAGKGLDLETSAPSLVLAVDDITENNWDMRIRKSQGEFTQEHRERHAAKRRLQVLDSASVLVRQHNQNAMVPLCVAKGIDYAWTGVSYAHWRRDSALRRVPSHYWVHRSLGLLGEWKAPIILDDEVTPLRSSLPST